MGLGMLGRYRIRLFYWSKILADEPEMSKEAKQEHDTLVLMHDNFVSAIDHPTWVNFAGNARRDFEFREGKQWTSNQITEIESRGQAPIVENEIAPIIERLIGQYKSQKTKATFRGRNLGDDEKTAEVLQDLNLHAKQQSDYEFEEGDMFEDANVCGFGVMEVKVELDDLGEASVAINNEDALNFFPDPYSRKYDWNIDGMHQSRAKWVSLDEAQKLHPNKSKELQGFVNLDPVNNSASNFKKDNFFDDKTQRIRLVEQWYKVVDKREMALFSNTKVEDITDMPARKRKKLVKDNNAKVITRVRTRIKMGVFVGRHVLLESKDSPYDHGLFPFVPYFIRRKKDGEPYSMVRLLIDPQTEVNKRRSKALHLLSMNQAVFESGAVKDIDKTRKEMNRPDGMVEYSRTHKFEMVKNIEVANTQIALLGESKVAISRISGVPDESLARNTEIRSGIGLQRKQQQANITSLPIFANLRRSRFMIDRLIFGIQKQFYTEEKVLSVTDDLGKAKSFTLTQKQIDIIKEEKFDLTQEEMPDTTTIQDEQFRIITDILRGLNLPPQFALTLLPIIIQLSQIRGKEAIMEQIKTLGETKPELPKLNLQLVWSELTKEEKAFFAQQMGAPELAQFEAQAGADPAHVTKEKAGIIKVQIKEGGNGGQQGV